VGKNKFGLTPQTVKLYGTNLRSQTLQNGKIQKHCLLNYSVNAFPYLRANFHNNITFPALFSIVAFFNVNRPQNSAQRDLPPTPSGHKNKISSSCAFSVCKRWL